MIRSWILTGVTAFAFAAAFSQNPSEGDAEAVKRTLTEMWAAIERGDLEAYGSFIHPDFTAFGENDTYLLEGKDQELRSMRSYLKRARDIHTEMHQPQVTVRGDTAWIVYYWTDEGYAENGRFTSRGKSTRIFVREGGRWLCIHGHYTSVE